MAKGYGNKGAQGSNQIKNLELIGLETGRKPPQALDIEEAVLGALMIEKDAYSVISEILRPESFYDHKHQLLYKAITTLAMRQQPIDILTVAEQLRSTGELEEAC